MKRWLGATLAVVLVLLGGWLYRWWHSPAESIVVSTGAQSSKVLSSENVLVPWETSQFTSRYPSNLRIITSNEVAQGITVGQYLLGSTDLRVSDQLAVTVGKLEDLNLAELPAVKFRATHPESYEQTTLSFTPPGGLAYSSVGAYEVAIFWQEDGRFAAVVASGSSVRQAELEQQLESVIKEWRWRQ